MPKKKTQEEFVEEAIKIHGDKYDYSKVNYVNAKTKVIIICKIHGEFEQVPNSHIQGNSCKKCANLYISQNMLRKQEEFIEEAIKIHGDRYDYSKTNYIDSNNKVKIICKEHGEFEQTPRAHINHKYGCINCGYIIRANKNTYSQEEFIEKAIKIHGDRYDYSKTNYIDSNNKVKIICKEIKIY